MQDYGMKKNTPRHSPIQREVARELRKIRAAHPELAKVPDAAAAMARLAAIRCRFKELTALIEAAGGAGPDNLDLLVESRQCSRAASAIERDLRGWWSAPAAVDPFRLMVEARRQLLGLPARSDDVIDGAIEQPAEHIRLPRA